MTYEQEARQFWRDVYVAAIRKGENTTCAENMANTAYGHFEDLFVPPSNPQPPRER